MANLVQPEITEAELRELLDEAGLPADDAQLPQLLAAVQPMRARIRASAAKGRGAMLRGAAMSVGAAPAMHPSATGPRGAQGSARRDPGAPDVAPDTSGPRAQVSLVKRLAVLFVAVGVAFLTLVMLMGEAYWFAALFGTVALLLAFAATTGRGLAPKPRRGRVAAVLRSVVGGYLLLITAGPILVASLWSLLNPSELRQGGFIERAMAVIGLLTLYIVGSHVRGMRRGND